MTIEWDPAKNRANLRKHGISFEIARAVFDDPDRIELFDERDYDEERWVVIGAVGQSILFVVYTIRNGDIRLISARKADRDDQTDYYEGKACGVDADLMDEQEDFNLAVPETDWARIEAMTDEEALQNALDDPDAQPLTPEQRARLRRYPDPKRIRLGLDLTQEQFARRFEIALGTLRDWEQNVRLPDSTAKAYLRVIANDPEGVDRALAKSYRRD